MVKLIRLTSEKDCVFNVNLDEELIVSTKAQMGVKNLTFEPNFQVLNLTGGQGNDTEVKFGADVNVYGDSEAYLSPVEYNSANFQAFFTDLTNTLNDTLEPLLEGDAADSGTEKQDFYGQFFIEPDNDRKIIQFRLTPVIVPFISREAQTLTADPAEGWATSTVFLSSSRDNNGDRDLEIRADGTPPATVGEMCLINQVPANAATNARDSYFVCNNPSTRWCVGSSVFWVRIAELSANAGAADTNGFEIGLGDYQGFDIEDTSLDTETIKFAIRVQRPADDIQHIVPNADFTSNPSYVTNTGVTPSATVNAEFGKRDVVMIQREKVLRPASGTPENERIRGYLFKEGVAPTVLFSYNLARADQQKSLYPYICMFGAKATTVLSQPSMTFDPFEIDNKQDNGFINLLKPAKANKFGGVSSFDSITMAPISENTALPDLSDAWFDGNPSFGYSANTQLTISQKVLSFMGFGETIVGNGRGDHTFKPIISTTAVPFGFDITPRFDFQLASSDNYVVIIDSAKLKSYDGSSSSNGVLFPASSNKPFDKRQGKRMNILATIPENDNASGIVEFQANEVLYIDMDNKAPINIRNLNLRVLTKELRPIETQGLSVMTLLIKDE